MVKVKFLSVLADKEVADGRRYNVKEIAEGVGVSRQTIYTWMEPDRLATVNLKTLDLLCKFFDCDISDLLEYRP